jgi:lipopolysaccharide export system protein LptA
MPIMRRSLRCLTSRPSRPLPARRRLAGAARLIVMLAAALLAMPAAAEKADRSKPMVIEADQPGTLDLQHQIVVFNGNVVLSQGTMVLRAQRVEMRELPDGYRTASASGGPGQQVTWRQKRDGVDETVEGVADRIEYDGRTDTLRFVGNAAVRRLRGAAVADEVTGATILWDNLAQVFRVESGAATAANPAGRVRAVISPRAEPASGPVVPTASPAAPMAPSRDLRRGP